MTVIVGADERLISYNRFSIDRAILKLPTSGNEVALAERIWDEVDPDYAAGLDYMRNRRATEEWNYDNWVLAREGKGPQLKAPEALA